MKEQPIGIFDSGVGGTSIWKEIHNLLPNEHTIYLSDSKNSPYGIKDKNTIIDLSVKNTELLLKNKCKLIVVACNTATTNTIDYLREKYNVPFIGIEPAIKPAALKTKTNSIGILATKGTLSSSLFSKTSKLFTHNIKVTEQVGNGIVELIEDGKLYSSEMTKLLQSYIQPMVNAQIDYLVLGCTHYPYLIPQLEKILPKQVSIIDSGEAVARQTKAILEKYNLLNDKKSENTIIKFFTNGNIQTLDTLIDPIYKSEYLDF